MIVERHASLRRVPGVNFLWETYSAMYTFFTICKQNDVISQSYKIVDDSKMKQGITKL